VVVEGEMFVTWGPDEEDSRVAARAREEESKRKKCERERGDTEANLRPNGKRPSLNYTAARDEAQYVAVRHSWIRQCWRND
jgi:hypothetical protein